MRFVSLATGYYIDPAVVPLTDAAEVAFTRSIAYSGAAETNGFIPKGMLPSLIRNFTVARGRRVVADLVEASLWIEVAGGWRLRSWEKHQDALEKLLERRRADADRQRKHRAGNTAEDGGRAADQQEQSSDPAASRQMSRDAVRDNPFARARPQESEVELDLEVQSQNPFLAVVCRLTLVDASANATTTDDAIAHWRTLAGHADLETEARSFLLHNENVQLRNPGGAWRGWLRAASQRASCRVLDSERPDCPDCDGTGWAEDDEQGRAVKCHCRNVITLEAS